MITIKVEQLNLLFSSHLVLKSIKDIIIQLQEREIVIA